MAQFLSNATRYQADDSDIALDTIAELRLSTPHFSFLFVKIIFCQLTQRYNNHKCLNEMGVKYHAE